jgi:hypothetical protein
MHGEVINPDERGGRHGPAASPGSALLFVLFVLFGLAGCGPPTGPVGPGRLATGRHRRRRHGVARPLRVDPETGAGADLLGRAVRGAGRGAGVRFSTEGLSDGFQPYGMAVAPDGDLVVAYSNSGGLGRVVRVDPTTGVSTLLSEDGALGNLRALALLSYGGVVVTDENCCDVGGLRHVDPVTGTVTTLVTNFFDGYPMGVAVEDDDHVLLSVAPLGLDSRVPRVLRVDPVTGASVPVCRSRARCGNRSGSSSFATSGSSRPVSDDGGEVRAGHFYSHPVHLRPSAALARGLGIRRALCYRLDLPA